MRKCSCFLYTFNAPWLPEPIYGCGSFACANKSLLTEIYNKVWLSISVPPQLLGNPPRTLDLTLSNNEFSWNQNTSCNSETVWREISVNNRLCSLRVQICTAAEVIRYKRLTTSSSVSSKEPQFRWDSDWMAQEEQVQLKYIYIYIFKNEKIWSNITCTHVHMCKGVDIYLQICRAHHGHFYHDALILKFLQLLLQL